MTNIGVPNITRLPILSSSLYYQAPKTCELPILFSSDICELPKFSSPYTDAVTRNKYPGPNPGSFASPHTGIPGADICFIWNIQWYQFYVQRYMFDIRIFLWYLKYLFDICKILKIFVCYLNYLFNIISIWMTQKSSDWFVG